MSYYFIPMKNKILLKNSIILLLPLSAAGVLFGISKPNTNETDAYSVSSLPTTIDLNDSTSSEIRNYYSSLNSLSTSERQGTNLLKNLKTILKNGQNYFSYDVSNGLPIWQMYEITDRDWELSPASSTTYGTYNASTNTITNYSYGSNSDYKNDPYVHSLYTNRTVTNQAKAWGDHSQTNWGINREHVWPKAEGFEAEAAGGARGDPMHLMAGNGYANNIHSNYFYGYVNTSISYTDCGAKYSYTAGNFLGKSKTLGGTINVFEPQDCDKGDIARACFYMVARYNYLSGSDSDGIDSNNPNLSLTQSLSDWSQSSFNSSADTKGYMGVMTDLLAWHHADPVDDYEIHRNNLLFKNFTNNRNPFIDFPEWVDYIWGTATYNGTTYQSHSTTPTGYAKPSSDIINGYNSNSNAEPTSISASVSKTYKVGETISASDITVLDNNNNVVTDFSFSNNGYQFSYADAASGGSTTSKTFANSVSKNNMACSLTVNVCRENYVAPTPYTYEHTGSEFKSGGISATSYTTGLTSTVDGINFCVDGYIYSNVNLSLSNGKTKAPGKVINTTPYSSGISSVTVSGASPDIQLSVNGTTWVDYSGANTSSTDFYYFKLYYSNTTVSSYVNITQINVTIKGQQTPKNVANYVMFTDTSNQCTTKFSFAKSYFEDLNSSNRTIFMTSNDYVISNARERFEAWAAHLGKQITYSNNDYIVTDAQNYLLFDTLSSNKENNTLLFVVVSLLTGTTSLCTLILIKRRKHWIK